VVEHAVVLVVGQDEGGLRPHLGVGRDGVDLARDEGGARGGQRGRVLVEARWRQDPARGRQLVVHRVVLELAERLRGDAVVEERVAWPALPNFVHLLMAAAPVTPPGWR